MTYQQPWTIPTQGGGVRSNIILALKERTARAFEVGKTNLQSTLTALEGAAKTAQGVMQAVGTSSIEVATKKFS